MNSRIVASEEFMRRARKLAKKHKSLSKDLVGLNELLLREPRHGTLIQPDVYKVRLAIKSKGKGKSGGAKVITYVETEVKQTVGLTSVHLLTIYDKSEVSAASEAYLRQIIDTIKSGREEE
jgi:mRNA-degrading endonuclease RelE of RelBE toxin-antitoxin system